MIVLIDSRFAITSKIKMNQLEFKAALQHEDNYRTERRTLRVVYFAFAYPSLILTDYTRARRFFIILIL